MLPDKKRVDHAEDEGDIDEEECPLDFAWLLYMGMQFGFTQNEISHMYLGKWMDIFEVHKHYHNFRMKKGLYKEKPEKVSIFSI